MKSYWEALQDEIQAIPCDWCDETGKELYRICSLDSICRECLETEEYEEPEHGLTLAERNA